MAKHSLRLLFLRKYRTSKKIYRQLKSQTETSQGFDSEKKASGQSGHVNVNLNGGSDMGRGGVAPRKKRRQSAQVDSVDCCWLIYDCVSGNKLRCFVATIFIGMFTTTVFYFQHLRLIEYTIYKEDVFSSNHGFHQRRCVLPNLKPYSPEVSSYVRFNGNPPNCAHEMDSELYDKPFSMINGSIIVKNPEVNIDSKCCYRPFHRRDEKNTEPSNYCEDIVGDYTPMPLDAEFVEIICVRAHIDWKDAFVMTPKKLDVENRIKAYESGLNPIKTDDRLSVVILGLDATSRMNFIRTMPKSNKYLLKTMGAISLNGYTKVAENTLPNVVPFLTGRTLEEFKEICINEHDGGDAVHLDKCPFIWKKFAENGYRTGFAEDDVDISIFNMNWGNAFIYPPTDYYLRPFSMRMQAHHSYKSGYCYGPRLSFEKLLGNIKSMAQTFEQEPYFQFTWSTKLSHDDFNKMRWGDRPLSIMLEELYKNNYLNHTAFFVVGDHGSRLDAIRSTEQGKLEDRLPVAYIVMPEWFQTKYAVAWENLKKNQNLVTSAFDMHKTMYDLMNLNRLQIPPTVPPAETSSEDEVPYAYDVEDEDLVTLANNITIPLSAYRGTSLLRRLPDNRTCFQAGVPLHWCVCHKRISEDKNADLVHQAAEYTVQSLNTLLRGKRKCAELTLKSVQEASRWDPKEIIREGCENYNVTLGTRGECDSSSILMLQIAFSVSPSDAAFETTVIQLDNGKWHLTEEVVRTNAYEGQSACVEQKYKPYCYCEENSSYW